MMTMKSLDQIIREISAVPEKRINEAKSRTLQLVMPERALGRLHDIAERFCGIQDTMVPCSKRKAILIMAGDHGVAKEGVSAYPQEVTGQMVKTFLYGGAGINAVTLPVGIDVSVVDMGMVPDVTIDANHSSFHRYHVCKIRKGTDSFLAGPAMSREDALKSVLTGFERASELFDRGVDLLGTGDMGIGNTTPSAAIGSLVTGYSVKEMAGRGTGVTDEVLSAKTKIIEDGIRINQPDPKNGLDILSKIGGFEIGGIAGTILAGAYYRKPIVVDGFISTAGALIAKTLCPVVTDYLFAGHCSEEPGHKAMLNYLKLSPILDLGMRLGEGTGAALAMRIIDAALSIFNDVMTFDEAGVAEKEASSLNS